MNDFTFTEKGWEHYLYWQTQDRKTLKKINSLIEDIKRNGVMQRTGHPEPLKYRPGYSKKLDGQTGLCMILIRYKILK